MKRLILFSMVCFIATVTQAQNDSIKTETLQEAVSYTHLTLPTTPYV